MNVLVTGAGGFIGAGLVARWLTNGGPFTAALRRLVLLDQRLAEHADARVRVATGDLLRASMREIVDAIADVHRRNALANASFAPKAHIQAQFASCPLLRATASTAAGFQHDGALGELVRRALAN